MDVPLKTFFEYSFSENTFFQIIFLMWYTYFGTKFCLLNFFQLQLGALIPRSVCWSVCLFVCLCVLQKLQNVTNQYKTSKIFMNNAKKASVVCRSFLDGVVMFIIKFRLITSTPHQSMTFILHDYFYFTFTLFHNKMNKHNTFISIVHNLYSSLCI